jgi:hypothetical protein
MIRDFYQNFLTKLTFKILPMQIIIDQDLSSFLNCLQVCNDRDIKKHFSLEHEGALRDP